jgi:hypothetical protein
VVSSGSRTKASKGNQKPMEEENRRDSVAMRTSTVRSDPRIKALRKSALRRQMQQSSTRCAQLREGNRRSEHGSSERW